MLNREKMQSSLNNFIFFVRCMYDYITNYKFNFIQMTNYTQGS